MVSRPVADAHVDVLWRMDNERLDFLDTESLQASLPRLQAGGVTTQIFAIYVHTAQSGPEQLAAVMRQLDLFHERISPLYDIQLVTSQQTLTSARANHQVAALLSLEGGGCLQGDPGYLRVLHRLGVRGMGLTWNPANELADGCRESRGAGLTAAGVSVAREMIRLGMWIDIAHLADAGVADLFKLTDGPIMASHANARAIHAHPRNLTDSMIRELIRRRGWIGLTFEGSFVCNPEDASIERVCMHIDHMLELGAEDTLGFGSDFDGTLNEIPKLSHAGDYAAFGDRLVERYGRDIAGKLLFTNFESFLSRTLPDE